MVVDAALERGELAALGEVEQLLAAQHPARPRHQRVQEIVLAGRKRDRDAVLDRPARARPIFSTQGPKP